MDKAKAFVRGQERAFGAQTAEEVTEETIETKVEEIVTKEEFTIPQGVEELGDGNGLDDQSEEE